MNLHDALMDKARAGRLSHFYILEATGSEAPADGTLQEFIHHFIRDYYQKIEGHKQSINHLMDHPDVFVLGNLTTTEDPEDKFFSVSESESLARFFEFKAVQSKRKFAVITEAHRINALVANKWLKLLEEPFGECTIFLLNPRRQKLLDTLHSRALHLRLMMNHQESNLTEWMEFLGHSKQLSLSQFIEKYSKAERSLTFWVSELIRWESLQTDQLESKDALKDWLKNFQEMEIFHQPTATKWSLFYSYLHEHVLPRASH